MTNRAAGGSWIVWQKKRKKSRSESAYAKQLCRTEVHCHVFAEYSFVAVEFDAFALLSPKTGLMPADDRSAEAGSSWQYQRLDRLNASHGAFSREDGVQVAFV